MKLNISFNRTKACFIYRNTQKISDTLWAMLWNGWKCIFNCVPWFLIFSNKVEKCLCFRFVCLAVRLCTFSNFRKYSLNVLKFMYVFHIWNSIDPIANGIHIQLMIHLYRRTKIFQCITAYGVNVYWVF